MNLIVLDGACMTSRRTAHLYLQKTLRLPDYYGRNLDALWDCLSTLTPDAADPTQPETLILLRHADALHENLGEYGDRMLTLLFDARQELGLRFALDPS